MSSALVILQGRLAADPEDKTDKNGKRYLKVSVPVDQGYGDTQTTGWYNVTLRDDLAERVFKAIQKRMFLKGMNVLITGPLTQRSYTTNGGESRTSMDVDAKTFEPVLMPRDQAQSSEDRPTYTGSMSPQSWPQEAAQGQLGDLEDVPF